MDKYDIVYQVIITILTLENVYSFNLSGGRRNIRPSVQGEGFHDGHSCRFEKGIYLKWIIIIIEYF